MSFFQSSDVSPFAVCTISGSNTIGASVNFVSTTVFDTTDQSWASFNSSTKKIDTTVDTFAVACYSPNSNSFGILTYQTPPTDDMVIRGQVLPISSGTGGSIARGDDQAYYISSSQLFQYRLVASATETPDTARSVMTLMTIGA